MKRTIYMSTSTLENAVETLLNAGCFEHYDDAKETAARRLSSGKCPPASSRS